MLPRSGFFKAPTGLGLSLQPVMHRGGVRLSGAAALAAPVLLQPPRGHGIRHVAAGSRSMANVMWSCLLQAPAGVLGVSCVRSGLCRPRRQGRSTQHQRQRMARYSTQGPEDDQDRCHSRMAKRFRAPWRLLWLLAFLAFEEFLGVNFLGFQRCCGRNSFQPLRATPGGRKMRGYGRARVLINADVTTALTDNSHCERAAELAKQAKDLPPPSRGIGLDDVDLSYSRSSGPGGQNVNKADTQGWARRLAHSSGVYMGDPEPKA
eukprot:Skav202324  [mRNA]  locus=scaffold60:344011:353026:+ [translate_table: standard]